MQISAEINHQSTSKLGAVNVKSIMFARIQSLVGLEDEVLMFSTFAEAIEWP